MSLARWNTGRWDGIPQVIDNRGPCSLYPTHTAWTAATAWGTQYLAIYQPVRVPRRYTVVEMAYYSGTTATGNIDIGIYDSAGTRLVSSGSTAKGNTTAYATVDVTDTTIGPGIYYLALCNDTTTDTFTGAAPAAPIAAAWGILTETLLEVTLPTTATWALSHTLAFVPGIAALGVTEVT